ncbi:MAG: Holliday junction branch migration protein RuvA, partial [Gluconobacter oxydans]
LAATSPGEILLAIIAGDKGSLPRAAGVGPRVADRILIELINKVAKMPGGGGSGSAPGIVSGPSVENDALLALAGLGFRRAEAWPVLSKVLAENENATLDLAIRLSLKDLAR